MKRRQWKADQGDLFAPEPAAPALGMQSARQSRVGMALRANPRVIAPHAGPEGPASKLLEEHEVLALTGYTPAWLAILQQQGKFPSPICRRVCAGGRWVQRRYWRRPSVELHVMERAAAGAR